MDLYFSNAKATEVLMEVPAGLFAAQHTARDTWDLVSNPFQLESINSVVWSRGTKSVMVKFEDCKVVEWRNPQDMEAAGMLATEYDAATQCWTYERGNYTSPSLTDVQVSVASEGRTVPFKRRWTRALPTPPSGRVKIIDTGDDEVSDRGPSGLESETEIIVGDGGGGGDVMSAAILPPVTARTDAQARTTPPPSPPPPPTSSPSEIVC